MLIADSGYPHRAEHLIWLPGAVEAVRWLNASGYLVIVVTNQSGVARGYFPEEAVRWFHDLMAERMMVEGARIDAFYYCPFHPEAPVERYRTGHAWRKPAPGMILQAMADWPVRREGSFLIGDRPSDLAAAAAAGIPGFIADGRSLLEVARNAAAAAAQDGGGLSSEPCPSHGHRPEGP